MREGYFESIRVTIEEFKYCRIPKFLNPSIPELFICVYLRKSVSYLIKEKAS